MLIPNKIEVDICTHELYVKHVEIILVGHSVLEL